MNKLYFLVLLVVSLSCASAALPTPGAWFSAMDATVGSNGYVSGWRAEKPADNAMRPFISTKKAQMVNRPIVGDKKYQTVYLKGGCLHMTAYYSVQTLQGWSIAMHTSRGKLNGYLFGGNHQSMTPALLTSPKAPHFQWKSCNGQLGSSGNTCDNFNVTSDEVFGENDMVTIIVSYKPNSVKNGNTTIYLDGMPVFEQRSMSNNRNWELNAVGCSGYGESQQAQAFIADFRIYEKAVEDEEAELIHNDMVSRNSTYVAATTPPPAPTTQAPIPTLPQAPPNITKAECSGHGYHLTNDTLRCVCDSGYEGMECEESNVEEGNCTVNFAKTTEGDYYPHLNTAGNHSNFQAGILYAEINAPIVKNRTFVAINFRNATDSKCFLGTKNTFWTQSVETCNDTFRLSMPWVFSSVCGFKKVPRADKSMVEYRTIVEMHYFDTLLDVYVFGKYLTRKAKVAFEMFITFPTVLTIQIDSVTVESEVLTKAVVTKFEIDSDTKHALVEITTLLNWPNMLSEEELVFNLPTQVAFAKPMSMQEISCKDHFNTTCSQRFTAELKLIPAAAGNGSSEPEPVCKYDGDYSLNLTTVTCRTNTSDTNICTEASAVDFVNMQFKIIGADICGNVMATPGVTAKLVPYDDAGLKNKTTLAKFGHRGWFHVDIHDEWNNDIELRFLDIVISTTANGQNYSAYLYKDGVAVGVNLTTPDPIGRDLKLQTYNHERVFNLTYNGITFNQIRPKEVVAYNFAVLVELTYKGNEGYTKREIAEITAVYEAPAHSYARVGTLVSMSNAQEEFAEVVAKPVQSSDKNKMLLVSIVVPLAGVVVLTVLAAAVYYIYNIPKKQSTFYNKL